MKKPVNLLNHVVCLVMFALLAGCVPWPHTTERSGEVHGRVLDAQTRAPIKGAKVFFVKAPHHTTQTDANGCFHLKATRNFEYGYMTPGAEWPVPKGNAIDITYPGYEPDGFAAALINSMDVGDILLKPKK